MDSEKFLKKNCDFLWNFARKSSEEAREVLWKFIGKPLKENREVLWKIYSNNF